MRARQILLALGGLAAVGCTGIGTPTGTRGELGNGVFSYSCDGPADPMCDDGGQSHAMPKAVAVGSRFSVTFTPVGEGVGSATVEPASKELLVETETLGSSFKALKPGVAALLARRGDTVVDLVHVRISAVEAVHFDLADEGGDAMQIDSITQLSVVAGGSAVVRAVSTNDSGEALAGALSCKWTTADDGLLSIASGDSGDDRIQIDALGSGSTSLHVDLGDLGADLPIEIGLGTGGGGGGTGGSGGGAAGGSTGGGGTGGAGGGS